VKDKEERLCSGLFSSAGQCR